MKQRVTNEQAEKVICSNLIDCVDCFSFDEKLCCDIVKEEDIATDLLEARDTIEKQEAIIKEMREEINLTLRDFEKIDEVCKMANVMPFSLTKKKLCEIMEKTKEYAE